MSIMAQLKADWDEMYARWGHDTTALRVEIKTKSLTLKHAFDHAPTREERCQAEYVYRQWRRIVVEKLGIKKAVRQAEQDKGAVLFNGRAA